MRPCAAANVTNSARLRVAQSVATLRAVSGKADEAMRALRVLIACLVVTLSAGPAGTARFWTDTAVLVAQTSSVASAAFGGAGFYRAVREEPVGVPLKAGATDDNFVSQVACREQTFARCLERIERVAIPPGWSDSSSTQDVFLALHRTFLPHFGHGIE